MRTPHTAERQTDEFRHQNKTIAQLLFDDAREKSRSRPRARAVSKKNPRRVLLPADFIDRRTDARYRSGPVIRSRLNEKERILLAIGPLPSWNDLCDLPRDEQTAILRPLVIEQDLTDRRIAELFGPEVTTKQVTNRRQSLGLKKFVRKDGQYVRLSYNEDGKSTKKPSQTTSRQTTPATRPAPAPVQADPMDDIRMRFSIGGKYSAETLSNRLMSLATLLSDSGFAESGYLYEVQIKIVETNEQAKTTQLNGATNEAAAAKEDYVPASLDGAKVASQA